MEDLILGNEDFKEYGTQSWLSDYKKRAEEDTADVDALYKEFAEKLQKQKEFIIKQQEDINNEMRGNSGDDIYDDLSDDFEEETERIERAVERQRKAYESVEEIRSRAY